MAPGFTPALALAFLVLSVACAMLLAAMLFRLGRASGKGGVELPLAEMKKHMVWGAFYANPDDPRGWVPKTSGVGQTVNFRTRRNARIFAALLAGALGGACGMVFSLLG